MFIQILYVLCQDLHYKNVMAMMPTVHVSQCIDYPGKHMIIQVMHCNEDMAMAFASDTSYIIL